MTLPKQAPRNLERPALPEKVEHIYLIGIGGTAMGSLAGLLKHAGYDVYGSDQALYPPMNKILHDLQIRVLEGYKASNLEPRPDLVVVGNACTPENPEVIKLWMDKIPFLSMPETLYKFFLKGKRVAVVTGTHGKTTTTSILAHILITLGEDPSFLAGGVLKDYNSTFKLGHGRIFVLEGDEYDTAFFDKRPKFVHYRPEVSVITSLEFDHADIYADVKSIEKSFVELAAGMPKEGQLLFWGGASRAAGVAGKAPCKTLRYGEDADCDIRLVDFQTGRGKSRITVAEKGTGKNIKAELNIPGRYNALNALAALGLARFLGVPLEEGAGTLSSFHGVARRQELLTSENKVFLVDDFAHHPTAVAHTIEAVRSFYSGEGHSRGKLWAIFEPRSNTARTNIHQQEYLESLSKADHVRIAKPYNPRNLPESRLLQVHELAERLRKKGIDAAVIEDVDETAGEVGKLAQPGDILLLMSNGDFGGMSHKLLRELRDRGPALLRQSSETTNS
ncbi:MAG: hypothetical protein GXP49_06070 [Deltaproteobacteria bacterium]|nr:hypothetical protein [Deltaproteobacteria bacterium]